MPPVGYSRANECWTANSSASRAAALPRPRNMTGLPPWIRKFGTAPCTLAKPGTKGEREIRCFSPGNGAQSGTKQG